MIALGVVNLKGGTAKTTSAAFLLHVLAESGLRVLGVDSDPQGSLLRWAEQAEWEVPVVGLAVANLHRQLPGIVGTDRDAVVIDTPPLEDHRSIVMSVLRYVTHVITPVAPTPIEYERLPAVRSAVDDAADLRPGGRRPTFVVLLTRAVGGAASTRVYRDVITEDGDVVLTAPVARRELFAQAYGRPIVNALNTAYGDAMTELLQKDVPA